MFTHPDLMLAQAREHQRELIATADRYRLLASVRRHRKGGRGADAEARPAVRGRPEGTLAGCGAPVVAPAP